MGYTTEFEKTVYLEWEDEVYNELTDEYEEVSKECEVELLVMIEFESGPSYSSGGEPGGIYYDILSIDGDDISDDLLSELIDKIDLTED